MLPKDVAITVIHASPEQARHGPDAIKPSTDQTMSPTSYNVPILDMVWFQDLGVKTHAAAGKDRDRTSSESDNTRPEKKPRSLARRDVRIKGWQNERESDTVEGSRHENDGTKRKLYWRQSDEGHTVVRADTGTGKAMARNRREA
mgnify:CR=1 FL=1